MAETSYSQGTDGKCPHCGCHVLFIEADTHIRYERFAKSEPSYLATESGGDKVIVFSSKCPNCKKPVVVSRIESGGETSNRLVHPFNIVRLVSAEVPKEIRQDFLEAASVLSTSEKASGALSRRCLQNLLTERNYKGKDLNEQIDLAMKDLPARIAQNLDAIRQIGNFAAHPMKFKSTGEIVDVEPEEAHWNLDVLEQLFDFYYVQPRIAEEKRKKLDAKLIDMGKQALKKP